MSGAIATLVDGFGQLGVRRAEGRLRALLRKLAENAPPAGIAVIPPVRRYGDFNMARAALKGELRIGGFTHKLTDLTPWEIPLPAPVLDHVLHRFDWLADMSALGTRPARERAQGWLLGWLDRFEDGSGPGWEPDVAALRFLALLHHHPFLTKGFDTDQFLRLSQALALHEAYLAETADQARGTVARVHVLSALIHGGRCFEDRPDRGARAIAALATLCGKEISDNGALASRNPEDLLELFSHLLWVRDLLTEQEVTPPQEILHAIETIAPVLRTLRLGDGTLARFHGGGSGAEGALDAALAASGARTRPGDAPAMGYARLTGARTVLVMDCARPPAGQDHAQAGTLAFEMSSGRRPVLVNTGPALGWLPDWSRVPRSTAAHNTLALDKTSSSGFAGPRMAGKPGLDGLQSRPAMVTLSRARDGTGSWLQARHDGYLEVYGLLHERRVFVSADGRELHGEDVLLSPDKQAQRRFQARIKGAAKLGVALSLHFHVHPDVRVEIDRASDQVHLTVESGERWLFRHSGGLIDVEPSVYISDRLAAPVESRQVVIRNRATRHEADFNWSLVREDDASRAVRDLGIDPADG